MKLSLGFSPCPNDTFIFDAMIHGKIDTEGLEFEVVMADVEELNKKAFAGELDITKLSYHAFAHLIEKYVLLTAGSALGKNCGPLLISKKNISKEEVKNCKIAIPGKYTTANFLLSLAFPKATNKIEMLFSEIENAVLEGRADAGLIIHENRFTYQEKGLQKIIDLGEYWERTTKLPIPLGGIVVKRSLPSEIQQKINRIMENSVRFALTTPTASENFVKKYAQEMDSKIMYEHINLYVNDFTVNLGKSGESAIYRLFEQANELNLIPSYTGKILIN
ncbi:MAG TPA: 1,4-dihydroxy-6-naphthoate synthase [Bacteroidetes bacterium]|nr:1,4-dihydroxy-6-naphthoate synthase [Bacteroidota bacterium]